MKSNTQKILPQHDIQSYPQQPQEIVFRDSKFIFYDNLESSTKPMLKTRNSNITKNVSNQNTGGNNLKSYRPQTSSTTIFRPLRRQKTCNKNSIASKDNSSKQNLKILLKPQSTVLKNLQLEKSRSQTQKSVIRSSYLSNRLKEESIRTQRSKNKNKSQIPQPVSRNEEAKKKNNKNLTNINKISYRNHQNSRIQKQENRKQNQSSHDRSKFLSKEDAGKNNQLEKHYTANVHEQHKQECQSSVKNITAGSDKIEQQDQNREKKDHFNNIRQLFGNHHLLLRINEDFLSDCANFREFPIAADKSMNHKSVEQLKIIDLVENSHEQNQLEQQLRTFNLNYKSSHRQNHHAMGTTNKDTRNHCMSENYSGLLTNSYIFQQGFERAPILTYLKTSQTKKLYNILISERPEKNISSGRNDYMDGQFNHQSVSQINGQQVKFVYIKPNPSINLFPKQTTYHRADQQKNAPQAMSDCKFNSQSDNKHQISTCKTSQLLFVKFIRYLYFIDHEIITRIFEPAINNVYSVWLFVNGCFEPLFVDGYFLLDEHLNHFYGDSGQFLWLPILIKCICKLHNTYDRNILQKIKPQQIYKLLTGMDLVLLPSHQISQLSSSEFWGVVSKYLFKGHLPLSFSNGGSSISLLREDDKSKNTIVSYNHFSKQIVPFTAQKRTLENVIVLQPFFNLFVYTFQIAQFSLNKLELLCPRDTQIVFCLGNDKKKQMTRIYIYQSQIRTSKKKSSKIKLTLKHQSQIRSSLKHKLKRGNYRIFVEKGQKKMHSLFAGKQYPQEQTDNVRKCQNSPQFNISLLTSHEIKVKQVEQLLKKGGWVEDSQNIYQNCSFHRQSRKQNIE